MSVTVTTNTGYASCSASGYDTNYSVSCNASAWVAPHSKSGAVGGKTRYKVVWTPTVVGEGAPGNAGIVVKRKYSYFLSASVDDSDDMNAHLEGHASGSLVFDDNIKTCEADTWESDGDFQWHTVYATTAYGTALTVMPDGTAQGYVDVPFYANGSAAVTGYTGDVGAYVNSIARVTQVGPTVVALDP